MVEANDNLQNGLPQLTQLEVERWQKLILMQENIKTQIENFVMQLLLKNKLDPEEVLFDFNTGKFVKRDKTKAPIQG